MAAPLIAYIDWAIAENEKPCSAYYHTAMGKGLLVGAGCPYCSDGAWEYDSTNVL